MVVMMKQSKAVMKWYSSISRGVQDAGRMMQNGVSLFLLRSIPACQEAMYKNCTKRNVVFQFQDWLST
jgi:hypothetical protein